VDGGEQIERHLSLYSGATEEEEVIVPGGVAVWLQVHDEVVNKPFQGQLYHMYEKWLQMSFKSMAGRSFVKPD